MKIKLKLTPDQLTKLNTLMSKIDEVYKPDTMEGKAIKSISYGITDKIHNKYLKLQRSLGLFSQNETIRYELAYHEAFALFKILNAILGVKPDHDLQTVHNFIHQKIIV
ncbi:hypothetical protein BWK63_14105 [Flavobacterium covae]|uniref:hypothetical protein n=1 Tax=Flavobacterium TaxID=237 RepID=UPI000B4DD781|nr:MULTISPECIES: hypothetical protein [Flavobacterium]OWP79859.1 hypothetical protein BWK63_14105 [Flavobacterium covae]POR18010.1 hypothetical protein BWK57_14000 [Flavobacterium columnare]